MCWSVKIRRGLQNAKFTRADEVPLCMTCSSRMFTKAEALVIDSTHSLLSVEGHYHVSLKLVKLTPL